MSINYADLANYEFEKVNLNDFLDKFITTPEEYAQYKNNIEQLQQENQYLKEQNIENTVDIPTPNITGDKTIDLILMVVVLLFIFKSM